MEVVELYELELHRLVTADDGPELPIAYGQTKNGELDESDPQSNEERGYYDQWVFTGQAGDTVTIEMRGERATYLILRGPNGEEIDRAGGAGPSGYNQLEEVELPSSGQYTIIATSYSRSATFAYELTLTRTGTASGGDTNVTPTATVEPAEGDEDDSTDDDGDEETSTSSPGFGVGIAVLAILGVALLALRRR
jgi:PGF-CTERM protein